MKQKFINLLSVLSICIVYGQVGVNTETPKATMDVVGKATTTSADGLIAPRMTRAQLSGKTAGTYGADQTGTIIYVSDVSGGTAAGATINVTAAGYYYFDGSVWQTIGSGGSGTSGTPFNLDATTTDAGSSKTANIVRSGSMALGNTTVNSSAILELTAADKALLIPRIANTSQITSATNGMMIYDISAKCIKGYENNLWTDCYANAAATVVTTCGGFSGTYNPNVPLSGAIYSVTFTNNSFSTSTITLSTSDLVLSGIPQYTVTSVSTPTITLATGASQTVNYTISGTALSTGTLTGVWKKLSLSCTSSVDVVYPPTATSAITVDNATPQFQTTLLSDKGPYAARSLSIFANAYLDYGMTLSGDLKVNELNTAVKTVYSDQGLTVLGGASGSDVLNGYNKVICPDNTIVTGIEAYATGALDYWLHLQCTALNTGYTTEVGQGVVDSNVTADNMTAQYQVATCPAGQYMKGVQMYSTSFLDYNIGLYCTTITP